MMGIVMPETCWANNKICNKNLCCIYLAFYFYILTMMHGQNHIKKLIRYCPKQTKEFGIVVFCQNAETRDSSDTLTSSYQTTRRHIPEEGSPHVRHCGDLKIHIRAIIVMHYLLLSLLLVSNLFLILVTPPFPSSTHSPPSSLSFDYHLPFLNFLLLLFLPFSLVLLFLVSQLWIRLRLLLLSHLLHLYFLFYPFIFVFCTFLISLSLSFFLPSPNFLFFLGALIFLLVLRHFPFTKLSFIVFISSLVFSSMLLSFLLHGFNPQTSARIKCYMNLAWHKSVVIL